MKYIDAEKLKAEIRKLLIPTVHDRDYDEWEHGRDSGFIEAISIIESLQQEQPNFPITNEQVKEFLATHPKIEVPEKYKNPDWLFKKQEQPDLPGIEESGIPGKDYIPVDWVDACEMYGKWKIVKQEQPEVDLKKIIEQTYHDGSVADTDDMDHVTYENIARHFYALGRNARKEESK